MVNKHKVAPETVLQLAQRIQRAAKAQDWDSLKSLDLKTRELLQKCPACLTDAAFRDVMTELKNAHQLAFQTLRDATCEMETELDLMQAQQERAKAYQLAMTMEY